MMKKGDTLRPGQADVEQRYQKTMSQSANLVKATYRTQKNVSLLHTVMPSEEAFSGEPRLPQNVRERLPEFSRFVRLQTETPPGWPLDPDQDEEDGYKRSINLGNTCTKEQFDIMSAQLYKLLVVFLDVKTHKGGPNCNDFLSH